MALLDVRSVSFYKENRAILDNLDLSVQRGEIHALLGSNGTGKSTLARLVMGCSGYEPSAGDIVFDNQVINGLTLYERARLGVTMAWQEPARFEGLGVWSFLALGKPGIEPSVYLQKVGLDPELYKNRMLDKNLSGGERKRIELASILAMQPRLAILDEPASGIDLLSIGEIAEVIQSLKGDGTSILLISHREEIARIADRASYLCKGKIICTGAPDEIAEKYKSRACHTCNGVVCR
jgi:Fe-S cluster assembly ATP-binding protein